MEEENKVETLDETATTPVVETIEPVTEAPTVVVETPTEAPAPAPEPVTEAPTVAETPTEPVTEATKDEPATEAAAASAEPAEQKKKGKGGVLLILLILVLAVFAVWFFVLGGNEMLGLKKAEEAPQQEEKEEQGGEKPEENSNEEVELDDSDSATKDRIDKFISITSDANYDYSMVIDMLPLLVKGKKGLTDSEKAKIALYTLNRDRSYASVSELPEKYKDKEADIDVMVSLSFEQYENAYKDLFVDSANIDEEVLKSANSCPFVDFIDSDSKTIYMREACGGAISAEFGAHQVVIDRYTKQGNVYRAYTTYTATYPDSSKDSTSKVTWVFDKDGRFTETVVTE